MLRAVTASAITRTPHSGRSAEPSVGIGPISLPQDYYRSEFDTRGALDNLPDTGRDSPVPSYRVLVRKTRRSDGQMAAHGFTDGRVSRLRTSEWATRPLRSGMVGDVPITGIFVVEYGVR
ncbi:MAG: hypothetical protein WBA25_03280 [Jannaschia sp.]